MKSSRSYLVLGLCCQLLAVGSLATTESPVKAMQMSNVEESTVSPLSVMSEMDEPHMKTSTERPPVVKSPEPEMESKDPTTTPRQSVRKTVGDFIIHPLIAFKPRTDQDDDDDTPLGKQAPGSTSNSTSPWSLFAFNAGQGFGSSVSSLAGSVSSWLGQRMPVLVETPVRETTTTTTTTTTPRPDIIVRVQHKPSRKPLIAINNQNRPHSLGSNNNLDLESDELEDEINANRFGNIDDYDEEEDEDYVSGEDSAQQEPQPQKKKQKKKKQQQVQPAAAASEESAGQSDEEPEVTNDVEEDEDDEDIVQRPPVTNRKRPLQNQRRRVPVNHNRVQQQRRRVPAGNRRLRPQQYEEVYYEDVEEDDDENDEDEDAEEAGNSNDRFYYGNKYSSSRRSQSQPNFIQRGQQSLIKQIRQFTRGRTPAEMAAATRKGQKGASSAAQPQRRRQGTLFVNRNGQPVYVAPQLQQPQQQQQFYIHEAGVFPQPPLTTPIKRKGRPTQYITIPWSQLGIQPPTQIVGVAEGLQQQPLIFRMPPNAVAGMQGQRKQKRPMITADAVPLLAEASLMDIFKPPKIPASRSGSKPVKQNEFNGMNAAHSRLRPGAPQRIKSGTIVEKAPANSDEQQMMEQQQAAENSEKQMMGSNNQNNEQQEFIMVGEDDESGVARQAQAIFGESRFFGRNPIIEALGNGRFAVRKGGRSLEGEQEQQIPVRIVVDGEEEEKVAAPQPHSEAKVEVEAVEAPVKPVEVVADKQTLAVEPIVVPEALPVPSTPVEEQRTV